MPLAKCVEKYAPDDTTKQLLLRATWIGNDYAHYETKHEEINLNDLKTLGDMFGQEYEENDVMRLDDDGCHLRQGTI